MKTDNPLGDARERERFSRAPTLPEIDAPRPASAACVSRILVPTDFTEASDRALDYAVSMGNQLGASVVVCHVYQLPTALAGAELGTMPSMQSTSEIDRAARIGVDQALSRHVRSGVPIVSVVRPGNPEIEIRSIAREMAADLIVLGTHGRTGLMRALVGSVSDDVLHHSEIPVVVVHGERHENS